MRFLPEGIPFAVATFLLPEIYAAAAVDAVKHFPDQLTYGVCLNKILVFF